MRRTLLPLLAVIALLVGIAVPASASTSDAGWEPAPSAPWDVPAGARCDFGVHGEPVVDEVVQKVLARHPDGSARLVAYKGPLVIRITNAGTGATYDADAGGSALVRYDADGSQLWKVRGPVLVGIAENGGNLPRGLYIIRGEYTLQISPTGYKTVNPADAEKDDLCSRISGTEQMPRQQGD